MTNSANRDDGLRNDASRNATSGKDAPTADRRDGRTDADDRIIGDARGGPMNPPPSAPPLQRHGDALLDRSGNRQGGTPPEEELTP